MALDGSLKVRGQRMETVLTNSPATAAAFIMEGEVVAFPTETVYGLGADVFQPAAIKKIFDAKTRPADNPLIAHIHSIAQVELLTSDFSAYARSLAQEFFPGPLTLVVSKRDTVPMVATGGLSTIGIRMPLHGLAMEFLRECGTPVVAPSANLSGRPSPTTWSAVNDDLSGRIACILRGEPTSIGIESTVVDCSQSPPVILRPGAVTYEQIAGLIPETVNSTYDIADLRKSPGTRYRHYAPVAEVVLVNTIPVELSGSAAYIGVSRPDDERAFLLVEIARDTADYARQAFDFFRRCDQANVSIIYCEIVPREGLGIALMDRLERAAWKV
jgi:L-threonylcarbamoyladenylate synthase